MKLKLKRLKNQKQMIALLKILTKTENVKVSTVLLENITQGLT